MTTDTNRILAWVGEQEQKAFYGDADSFVSTPILAQIVQELERTLTEIARMPCLGELLGEESQDGCASCQAKEALSRAAAHLPQKEE